MLFRKLFQLLVVGGAVVGASSGCTGVARAEQNAEKKADGGTSTSGTADGQRGGGTAPADAGTSGGGGVPGW